MRAVCHNICHKFVFSPEYTSSSKFKILCLSMISETTHWFCKAGELTHHPQVPHHALVYWIRGMDQHWFRLWTITPVWIHIWRWNDAQNLMWHRRGTLLFFNVICEISRSQGTKIANFDPNWVFSDCNSSLNSPMVMKWYTKFEVA